MIIRPRFQITVIVLLSLVFAFVGAAPASEPGWGGRTVGIVIILMSLVAIGRALRLGTVISRAGIRVRNFDRRDQVVGWDEVASIEVSQVDARAGIPIHGPVIVLGDGELIPVPTLGDYRLAAAEYRAAQLRELGGLKV